MGPDPGVRTDADITSGPDGNLWFPCWRERGGAICRMSPATRALAAFARPRSDFENIGIALAPTATSGTPNRAAGGSRG